MLETIYITRHGFRSNWVVDASTGTYSATITSPTGIPSDPPLAAHGVAQAKELAVHLAAQTPRIERIYSSPFYRCLETINPLAEALDLAVLPENGIGEWYGVARFEHPSPATPELLHTFFPRLRTDHDPAIIPSSNGETLRELHDRTAYALARIIAACDRDPTAPKAILLVTHAATNIAAGRALTGDEAHEVRTGTCSVSVYHRKLRVPIEPLPAPSPQTPIPETRWREGGLAGGWDHVVNGDCSFLSAGEERNWWFDGEEAWDFPLVKEGKDGVVGAVEGAVGGGPGTVPVEGALEEVIGGGRDGTGANL